MYKRKKASDGGEIKNITLNLRKRNATRNVVENAAIQIRKRCFGSPKGKYKLVIEEQFLELSDGVPSPLVLSPGKSLLEIHYNEVYGTSHIVEVTDNTKIAFSVVLNPQNVLDCSCKEGHCLQRIDNTLYDRIMPSGSPDLVCRVKYVVKIFNDKGELWMNDEPETKEIDISFDKLDDIEPEFFFVPSDRYKDGIEYDATMKEMVEIGCLHVANSGSLMMSPTINVRFKVIAKSPSGEELPDVITLGDACPTLNPWSYSSDLNPAGTSVSNVRCDRLSSNSYNVSKLDVNLDGERNSICSQPFPVYWNMSALKNPQSDEKIILSIQYRYEKTGSPVSNNSHNNENIRIPFRRNQSMMDLEILFSDPERSEVIVKTEAGAAFDQVPDFSLRPMLISAAQTYEFSLGLRNTASAGEDGAAIYIKDFKIGTPGNIGNLILNEPDLDPMRSIFVVEPQFCDSPMHMIECDDMIQFKVLYSPSYLASIVGPDGSKRYDMEMHFPYSFSYCIDSEGNYVKGRSLDFIDVKGNLKFKVVKFPAAEWLCIDFGSSAVVASYGAGNYYKGNEVNRLLKLGEEKMTLLSSVFKAGESVKRKDESETSEYLISSTTTLDKPDVQQYVNVQNSSANYGKGAVCFSPSTGMMDFSHIVPCLKSLMGHEILNKSMISDEHIRNSSAQINVNDIFKIVYKQLFELFIPSEALNSEKLVMSYPNTYAPKHIGILSRIAKDCMPNLRPDYLRFISESDAVAFYYLDKRAQIMRKSKVREEDFNDTNVLVYDMGAGTLDLTYFTRTNVGEKVRISIDGKMGVSKAGNYADFLLAQIIIDLIINNINQENAKKVGINNIQKFIDELYALLSLKHSADRDLDEIYKFKNYVKTSIKPLLNEPDKRLPVGLNLINKSMNIFLEDCTVRDILEHYLFTEFLHGVTVDVLSNFVSLFGKTDDSGKPSLPVDVVVFSGRMTGIKQLRNAVGTALKTILPEGMYEKCRFTDLASRKFISLDEDVDDVTALKTVVADGAMAFCTKFAMGNAQYELVNTNLYATYGLMIFPCEGDPVWMPLLDHRTQPSKKGKHLSESGMIINEYDTSKYKVEVDSLGDSLLCSDGRLDMIRISELLLLQSYSADTQKDWRDGKKEYMTVLGSYDVSEIINPCAVTLKVDKDNNLNLYVGSGKEDFLSKDDVDNLAFRKSSWPIIF